MSDYKHDTLTNRVTQLETRREDLDIDLGNTKEEIAELQRFEWELEEGLRKAEADLKEARAELAEYEHLNDIYQQVFG